MQRNRNSLSAAEVLSNSRAETLDALNSALAKSSEPTLHLTAPNPAVFPGLTEIRPGG